MINLNDRLRDPSRQQDAYATGREAMLWTSLPGIIQSFDPEAMTCEVQPSIQGKMRLEDGSVQVVVQPPAETRMHDLSDGFVIPGPYSQPKVIPDVSTEAVELRTDDRSARLSIFPSDHLVEVETSGSMVATVGGAVTVTAQGDVTLTCPNLTINCPQTTITGTLTVGGLITGQGGFTVSGGGGVQATCDITLNGAMSSTGDIVAGGISLINHTHTGVTPGGGSTGAPE